MPGDTDVQVLGEADEAPDVRIVPVERGVGVEEVEEIRGAQEEAEWLRPEKLRRPLLLGEGANRIGRERAAVELEQRVSRKLELDRKSVV